MIMVKYHIRNNLSQKCFIDDHSDRAKSWFKKALISESMRIPSERDYSQYNPQRYVICQEEYNVGIRGSMKIMVHMS